MRIAKAIVTGGAGFIGANLVDRLVDDGVSVLVVDDLSTGTVSRLSNARRRGEVTFHQMDVRAHELSELFSGFLPDVVFHLAAQIDVRSSVVNPMNDADINVTGTVNVLDAAQRAGVARVVFSSSGGATFGDTEKIPTPESVRRRPDSPYGVSRASTISRSASPTSTAPVRIRRVRPGSLRSSSATSWPAGRRRSTAMANRLAISSSWRT
jgi:UDP-glucose 4-epimerase